MGTLSRREYTIECVLFARVMILALGWILWGLPFLLAKRATSAPVTLDRRARWGIALQGVGYALLWLGKPWLHPSQPWRIGLSAVCLAVACVFSWTSVRALGPQWRVDAGLSADHELVRSGPYRVVRHPIYTSMLYMLLGTGFMVTPWLLFLPALMVFIIGTEIRVRIEDGLLASRFGEIFREYQQTVPAYIPFLYDAVGRNS